MVSTDDAYVNSYVTFVASRVSGQVLRVLVDDNDRNWIHIGSKEAGPRVAAIISVVETAAP
jgi:hypothetical protein